MLNKFREVLYVDDGVTQYECLKCHKPFQARGLFGWNYCPHCGTKWDGQLLWDETCVYERRHGWKCKAKPAYSRRVPEWRIDYKFSGVFGVNIDWDLWDFYSGTSQQVLRYVKQLRVESRGRRTFKITLHPMEGNIPLP